MKILASMVNKRVAMSYLLLSAVEASAADCLRDARVVGQSSGNANATKLRMYQCGADGRNLVQLEFNRLNDLAVGMLLKGGLPATLGSKLNNVRIIKNRVYEEFNRLIAEFGISETYSQGSFGVSSAVPATQDEEKSHENVDIDSGVKVIVTGQAQDTAIDFPDPDALASITSRSDVPRGYSTVPPYSNSPEYFYIWRFMREDELPQYEQKVKVFNRLVIDPRFAKRMFRERVPREIKLNAYLGQRGLPKDFLFIRGYRNEGGCGDMPFWEFKYFPRRLLLNLVSIENVSMTPVLIDGLTGDFTDEPTLRAITRDGSLANSPSRNVTGPLGVLPPGGRVLVPLGLVWAPTDEIAELWTNSKGSAPKMLSYAWGPQLDVGGVIVAGQRLSLEGRAANFLAVTTSCECGSCPYLYAWDEANLEWMNSGVMLEFANSPAKAMWDWRKFEGAVLRYRVQEDEAEVTSISNVCLDVEMLDGTCLALTPTVGEYPTNIDLMFHEGAEYSFELPSDVCRENIRSSTFRLRGHYRRYTDILAATRKCAFVRA